MSLVSIADLSSVSEDDLELAKKLSGQYLDFLSTDPGDYSYTVESSSEEDRSGGVHASELNCARRITYSILNTERRVSSGRDVNMIMRMRLGSSIHALLQCDFVRMAQTGKYGFEFEPEVPIDVSNSDLARDMGLSSTCDGRFTILDESGAPRVRVGLEIKSASPKDYEKTNEPKQDHLDQSHVYMACLDLPLMWILYYNKGNSNFTSSYPPYLVRFDQKRWDKLQMRVAKCSHSAETSALPEREEGMHCSWCPFNYTCQPERLKRSKPPTISKGMYGRR